MFDFKKKSINIVVFMLINYSFDERIKNHGFVNFTEFGEANECVCLNHSLLDESRCSRTIKFYPGIVHPLDNFFSLSYSMTVY